MMNREKRKCFNIIDSTIKQATHKLLLVEKIASATECQATSTGLRIIYDCTDRVHKASEHLKWSV